MKLLRMVVVWLLVGESIALGEGAMLDWSAYRQMMSDKSSSFIVGSHFLIDAIEVVGKTVENAVLGQHKIIGCGHFYDRKASQMYFFCEVVYRTELDKTLYRVFVFRCEKTLLLDRQTEKKPYWRTAAIPPFQNCVDLRTCPLRRGVALFEKTIREWNKVPSLVAVYAIPEKDTIRWCFYGGMVWAEAAKEMGLGGDYNIFLDKPMRCVVQILGGK